MFVPYPMCHKASVSFLFGVGIPFFRSYSMLARAEPAKARRIIQYGISARAIFTSEQDKNDSKAKATGAI